MTIEEAIEALSVLIIFDAPKLSKAVNMAVAALRAQQAPAKLDRNRLAGCEYCKGDLEGYTSVIKGWKGPGRMYIPDGEANLVVSGTYGHRACIQIRFCPFCGRPLTGEAWAELERRIGGL